MVTVDRTAGERATWRGRSLLGRLPELVLAALLVASFLLIVLRTRDFVLYGDDWVILQARYDGGISTLFEPYNGHLMAVSVFFYKVLARAAGLDVHWPYMAVLVAGHLAAVVGVFAIARRRLGAWPALFVAAPLAVLGAAWESLVWPASLNFVLFAAGSVWAWWALDRGGRTGNLLALAFTLLATLSSGAAPCLHLALAAEILVRRRPRDLWVPGLPFVLFAVWLLAYGEGASTTVDSVFGAPQFAAEMAATAAAGLLGQPTGWGPPLVLAALAAGAWLAVRSPERITPRAIGVLVGLLAFLVLTGAVRGGQTGASSSRYVEVTGIFLSLLLVELLVAVRFSRRVLVAGGVLAAIAVVSNVGLLWQGIGRFGGLNDEVGARVGAFDLVPERAAEDFVIGAGLGGAPVAGPYRKLVRLTGDEGGSSPAQIAGMSDSARTAADGVLGQLAVDQSPARQPSGCSPVSSGETALERGAALTVRAGATTQATVRLRRFGGPGSGHTVTVVPGSALTVRTIADDAPEYPWRVAIEGAGAARCTDPS